MVHNFKIYSIIEDKISDIDKIKKLAQMNIKRGANQNEEDNAVELIKKLVDKNSFVRKDLNNYLDSDFLDKIFGKDKQNNSTDSNSTDNNSSNKKTSKKSENKENLKAGLYAELKDDNYGTVHYFNKIKMRKGSDFIYVVLIDEDDLYNSLLKSPYITFLNKTTELPFATIPNDLSQSQIIDFKYNNNHLCYFYNKNGIVIGTLGIFEGYDYEENGYYFEDPKIPILTINKI